MAFQSVPGVAELVLTYDQFDNDSIIQSVHHFHDTDGWTSATLALLVQSAVGDWTTDLRQFVPVGVSLVAVEARDLSTEFAASASAVGLPLAGTDAAVPTPPSVSALIRFIIGQGPPRRGRCFWPFVPENVTSEVGRLTTAYRTSLRTGFIAFIGSCEASTANVHVVVSRYSTAFRTTENPKGLRPAGVWAPVTDYQVAEVVASQRDRRPQLT